MATTMNHGISVTLHKDLMDNGLNPFLDRYEAWWTGKMATWDFIGCINWLCKYAIDNAKDCDRCYAAIMKWVTIACNAVVQRYPELTTTIDDVRQ